MVRMGESGGGGAQGLDETLTPTYDYTDDAAGWEQLSAAARVRDYSFPDGLTDPIEVLHHLRVSDLPHPSRGLQNHSETSNFQAHLHGVEAVMRQWQAADGKELYPDSICLGGLYHSIYGTQGFQACRFPPEGRKRIAALIGKRGELAAFYTCVMERTSWYAMLKANADIKQGEAPTGAIRPRQTGSIADTGYLRGDEAWQLSAQDFTDLCAVSLAHRLEHNECNRHYGEGDQLFAIMARHLGGAAEVEFNATIAAIEAARKADVKLYGGYSHVSGEAEPKLTQIYADEEQQPQPQEASVAKL